MEQEKHRDDWMFQASKIIESNLNIEEVIPIIRDLIGVDHAVYHSSRSGNNPAVQPYIQLTYPASWVKRYLQMGYVDVDPVLREGFLRTLPFDWSELSISSEAEGCMLHDALSHGVGPHGLSVPIRDKQGHRGLFSISQSGSIQDWLDFRNASLSNIVEIANRIHRRFLSDLFGEAKIKLSNRETECLFWTAQGKNTKDVSIILGISYHTTRDYIKSARFKLSALNAAQAINKAVKLGLLVVETPQ